MLLFYGDSASGNRQWSAPSRWRGSVRVRSARAVRNFKLSDFNRSCSNSAAAVVFFSPVSSKSVRTSRREEKNYIPPCQDFLKRFLHQKSNKQRRVVPRMQQRCHCRGVLFIPDETQRRARQGHHCTILR